MVEPRRHWLGRDAAEGRIDGSRANGRTVGSPSVDEARARLDAGPAAASRAPVPADHIPDGDCSTLARQRDAGGDRGDRLPQLTRSQPAAPVGGARRLSQRSRQRNRRYSQGRRRARSKRRLHARIGPPDSRRRGERQGHRGIVANRRRGPTHARRGAARSHIDHRPEGDHEERGRRPTADRSGGGKRRSPGTARRRHRLYQRGIWQLPTRPRRFLVQEGGGGGRPAGYVPLRARSFGRDRRSRRPSRCNGFPRPRRRGRAHDRTADNRRNPAGSTRGQGAERSERRGGLV